MKKLYTILLSLLVAAVTLVGVISLVDQDATESAMENRKLSAKPELTWTAFWDGSYISQLETYYSDTFPGREMLLKANQVLNRFYHFSGVGDSNMLVLEYQGGAEQGGQALEPIPEQTKTPAVQEQPS